MRKILVLALFVLVAFGTKAQRVLENPDYSHSTATNLDVRKVELTKEATFVTFCYKNSPGAGFGIPKGSFIQPVDNDKKHYILETTDIPYNKQFSLPASGEMTYVLKFPAIPLDTKAFNFGEDNEGGTWYIDNIFIGKKSDEIAIPEQLLGDWFDTNNGSWHYNIKPNKIIYDKEIWAYVACEESRKLNTLQIKKADVLKTLYFSFDSKGNLLIGEERFKAAKNVPKNCTLLKVKKHHYALHSVSKAENVKKNDQVFELPAFKQDSVNYSGRFLGWKSGKQKTGQIHIDNILSGKQESYVVKIADDGNFSITLPVYYPHYVYVRFPYYAGSVYLEPGKDLFHLINLGKGDNQFIGESAALNYDLIKVEKIGRFDYGKMQNKVLDVDLKAYKKFCFDGMQKSLEDLENIFNKGEIGAKAKQVKKWEIEYGSMNNAMEYEWTFESAYRKKHNIPRSQRKLDVEIEQADLAFYDFLSPELINNPLAVVSSSYGTFFNRIKYLQILRDENRGYRHDEMLMKMAKDGYEFTEKESALINAISELAKLRESTGQNKFEEKYNQRSSKFFTKHRKHVQEFVKENENKFDYTKLVVYLKEKGFEFSADEVELLEAIQAHEKTEYAKKAKKFNEENQEALQAVIENKHNEINTIMQLQAMEKRNDALKESFGVEKGFASDVMISQDFCRAIVEEMSPVSEKELARMQEQFATPFIKDYLELMNNKSLAKIEANKNKTDFVVNEVPKTEGEKLFKAIMKKYEGKVVLVDFWATWCGPCRSAIKRITPLKEELKNKDVVFVYITNPSSPEGTYNNMIPNIKGEHYRVSQDEWNFFSEEFQISGIPHYTLVGKKGEVLNPHLTHGMSNDQLKNLFLKHSAE